MGFRNDVIDILKKMDVGIITSLSEAFGRVTIEFMLSSMPVIGTNSGGTKEIVIEGETGYLYNVGDVNKLASCMQYYIEHHDYIMKDGLKGRNRAINMFSLDATVNNIYEIIRQFNG